MKITIKEARDYIKAKNIKPSDIFSRKDFIEDPVIKKYLEAKKKETKKIVTDMYQKRKRLERKYYKKRLEHEKKRLEHEEEMKRLDEEFERLKNENDDLITTSKKKREVNDGSL